MSQCDRQEYEREKEEEEEGGPMVGLQPLRPVQTDRKTRRDF